jgi:hypothetical protein
VERDGTLVDNGTSTTFVHSNLALDSMHFYRVRALIGSNWTAWSYRVAKRASADPVVESRVVESAHPYAHNTSAFYEIAKRNAKRMRVHFSRVETAPGDFISYEVSDVDEQHSAQYEGRYPNGFWSHWTRAPFQFDFYSNASRNAYGFRIDKIEYVATTPDAPQPPYLWEILPGQVTVGFGCTPGTITSNLYRSTAALGGYTKVLSATAEWGEYVDQQVSNGRTYYYKAACANDFGESPLSDSLKVRVQW